MLPPGSNVDHFTIMRLLGRGGMGEVYLARDTKLGRKVALKVVRSERLSSAQAIASFMSEARTTAQFSHPNIVAIHAVGEHQGMPYVALEYLQGQHLGERFSDSAPSIQETLRIGLAIAEALEEAHRHGILHRDLKPANIIIPADGRLRILDFGLAKRLYGSERERPVGASSGRDQTHAFGTPNYMAPEQWRHADTSDATDIWALGVILFKLCTERLPFAEARHQPTAPTDRASDGGGANATAPPAEPSARERLERLRTAVVSRDPAPPVDDFASVPTRLSNLIARCLEKLPDKRPDASEVAAALREMLQSESRITPDTDTPFRGLLPFTERHSALFFGRDAEIDAFVERLRSQPVLPLVGPSGVGKSSFVRAGVVTRLREQGSWLVISMRPGNQPFITLAERLLRAAAPPAGRQSLAPLDDGNVRKLARSLTDSPMRLSLELRRTCAIRNAKVLLVVDQLEELFTLNDEEALQQHFVSAACLAADDSDDPVRVILSLRHEFVDRLPSEGELGARVGQVFVLKPPDREALEQMVVVPLERMGYAFEDEQLAGDIADEVHGDPACLTLLQFAVAQMWEQRDEERHLLLRASYEQMGGVSGALARHADALVYGLTTEQRAVARRLLLRLVTADDTRRMLPEAVLLDGLPEQAVDVLARLRRARLVVDSSGASNEPKVELAHESLITTWKALAEWVTHQRALERFLVNAEEAAERWREGGEDDEELWSGKVLARAERMVAEGHVAVPESVQAFIRAASEHQKLHHDELEMLGVQFDARREARARRIVVGVLGSLWTFVPLITMQVVDPGSADYGPLFALPGGSLAVASALCLWKWEQLKRTALNRWAIATIFLALTGQMFLQLGGMAMGLPVVSVMNHTVLLWAMLSAMMILTVDLYLFPIPLGYLTAYFLSSLYSTGRHDVVYFMSGAHLVTTITVVMVWSPKRLARSLASYRRSL